MPRIRGPLIFYLTEEEKEIVKRIGVTLKRPKLSLIDCCRNKSWKYPSSPPIMKKEKIQASPPPTFLKKELYLRWLKTEAEAPPLKEEETKSSLLLENQVKEEEKSKLIKNEIPSPILKEEKPKSLISENPLKEEKPQSLKSEAPAPHLKEEKLQLLKNEVPPPVHEKMSPSNSKVSDKDDFSDCDMELDESLLDVSGLFDEILHDMEKENDMITGNNNSMNFDDILDLELFSSQFNLFDYLFKNI